MGLKPVQDPTVRVLYRAPVAENDPGQRPGPTPSGQPQVLTAQFPAAGWLVGVEAESGSRAVTSRPGAVAIKVPEKSTTRPGKQPIDRVSQLGDGQRRNGAHPRRKQLSASAEAGPADRQRQTRRGALKRKTCRVERPLNRKVTNVATIAALPSAPVSVERATQAVEAALVAPPRKLIRRTATVTPMTGPAHTRGPRLRRRQSNSQPSAIVPESTAAPGSEPEPLRPVVTILTDETPPVPAKKLGAAVQSNKLERFATKPRRPGQTRWGGGIPGQPAPPQPRADLEVRRREANRWMKLKQRRDKEALAAKIAADAQKANKVRDNLERLDLYRRERLKVAKSDRARFGRVSSVYSTAPSALEHGGSSDDQSEPSARLDRPLPATMDRLEDAVVKESMDAAAKENIRPGASELDVVEAPHPDLSPLSAIGLESSRLRVRLSKIEQEGTVDPVMLGRIRSQYFQVRQRMLAAVSRAHGQPSGEATVQVDPAKTPLLAEPVAEQDDPGAAYIVDPSVPVTPGFRADAGFFKNIDSEEIELDHHDTNLLPGTRSLVEATRSAAATAIQASFRGYLVRAALAVADTPKVVPSPEIQRVGVQGPTCAQLDDACDDTNAARPEKLTAVPVVIRPAREPVILSAVAADLSVPLASETGVVEFDDTAEEANDGSKVMGLYRRVMATLVPPEQHGASVAQLSQQDRDHNGNAAVASYPDDFTDAEDSSEHTSSVIDSAEISITESDATEVRAESQSKQHKLQKSLANASSSVSESVSNQTEYSADDFETENSEISGRSTAPLRQAAYVPSDPLSCTGYTDNKFDRDDSMVSGRTIGAGRHTAASSRATSVSDDLVGIGPPSHTGYSDDGFDLEDSTVSGRTTVASHRTASLSQATSVPDDLVGVGQPNHTGYSDDGFDLEDSTVSGRTTVASHHTTVSNQAIVPDDLIGVDEPSRTGYSDEEFDPENSVVSERRAVDRSAERTGYNDGTLESNKVVSESSFAIPRKAAASGVDCLEHDVTGAPTNNVREQYLPGSYAATPMSLGSASDPKNPFQPLNSDGRLSPRSLSRKLEAELQYSEALDLSIRELETIRRAQDVAAAQQEAAALARVVNDLQIQTTKDRSTAEAMATLKEDEWMLKISQEQSRSELDRERQNLEHRQTLFELARSRRDVLVPSAVIAVAEKSRLSPKAATNPASTADQQAPPPQATAEQFAVKRAAGSASKVELELEPTSTVVSESTIISASASRARWQSHDSAPIPESIEEAVFTDGANISEDVGSEICLTNETRSRDGMQSAMSVVSEALPAPQAIPDEIDRTLANAQSIQTEYTDDFETESSGAGSEVEGSPLPRKRHTSVAVQPPPPPPVHRPSGPPILSSDSSVGSPMNTLKLARDAAKLNSRQAKQESKLAAAEAKFETIQAELVGALDRNARIQVKLRALTEKKGTLEGMVSEVATATQKIDASVKSLVVSGNRRDRGHGTIIARQGQQRKGPLSPSTRTQLRIGVNIDSDVPIRNNNNGVSDMDTGSDSIGTELDGSIRSEVVSEVPLSSMESMESATGLLVVSDVLLSVSELSPIPKSAGGVSSAEISSASGLVTDTESISDQVGDRSGSKFDDYSDDFESSNHSKTGSATLAAATDANGYSDDFEPDSSNLVVASRGELVTPSPGSVSSSSSSGQWQARYQNGLKSWRLQVEVNKKMAKAHRQLEREIAQNELELKWLEADAEARRLKVGLEAKQAQNAGLLDRLRPRLYFDATEGGNEPSPGKTAQSSAEPVVASPLEQPLTVPPLTSPTPHSPTTSPFRVLNRRSPSRDLPVEQLSSPNTSPDLEPIGQDTVTGQLARPHTTAIRTTADRAAEMNCASGPAQSTQSVPIHPSSRDSTMKSTDLPELADRITDMILADLISDSELAGMQMNLLGAPKLPTRPSSPSTTPVAEAVRSPRSPEPTGVYAEPWVVVSITPPDDGIDPVRSSLSAGYAPAEAVLQTSPQAQASEMVTVQTDEEAVMALASKVVKIFVGAGCDKEMLPLKWDDHMDELIAVDTHRDQVVHSNLVFDCVNEILAELYGIDDSGSMANDWMKQDRPIPWFRRSPSAESVESEVINRFRIVAGYQDSSERAMFDAVLARQICNSEPQWINYDTDELSVALNVADILADAELASALEDMLNVRALRKKI